MNLYIVFHAPHGDEYRSYFGMSENIVRGIAAEYGVPFDLIDEETFTAVSESRQKK